MSAQCCLLTPAASVTARMSQQEDDRQQHVLADTFPGAGSPTVLGLFPGTFRRLTFKTGVSSLAWEP